MIGSGEGHPIDVRDVEMMTTGFDLLIRSSR